MIDFVKIAICSQTTATSFLKNVLLNFLTPLNEETGELHYPKEATFKDLSVKIFASNRVEIRGSLHKFWSSINGMIDGNGNGVNWNDFTCGDLCGCVKYLAEALNFSAQEARLENIEFGVNVKPPFSPTEFYQHILAHKNRSPGTIGKQFQIGVDFYRQQYVVKVYDKGKQYRKQRYILRWEIKVKRMNFLKETGIKTLSDLVDFIKLKSLEKILLQKFDELIINEPVDEMRLSVNEQKIYSLCNKPYQWEKFNRKQRNKYQSEFNDIIDRYGKMKWKKIIAKLIREKWNELLCTRKSGDILTALPKTEQEHFMRSNSVLNCSLAKPRHCLSCGRKISNQKAGSKFCSEKLYGKDAKRCRNRDSNPRNGLRCKVRLLEKRAAV